MYPLIFLKEHTCYYWSYWFRKIYRAAAFKRTFEADKGENCHWREEIIAGQKEKHLKEVRQKVGIVFQFPEHQLFEETIEKDICFGPMNFGVSEEDAKKRAQKAIKQVGLSEDILQKSPFDLIRRTNEACSYCRSTGYGA